MCGRYRLTAKERYLRDHFSLDEDPRWQPRWNIAPTQQVAAIRQHPKDPQPIFGLMRWGLIPYWAKDQNDYVLDVGQLYRYSPVYELADGSEILPDRGCRP